MLWKSSNPRGAHHLGKLALAGWLMFCSSQASAQETVSPQNVDRLKQVAQFGSGVLTDVAFSPEGKNLAIASSLGIRIYDAEKLLETRFITTSAYVESVAFSPDGQVIASGSEDGRIQLWRLSDGALLKTLRETREFISSLSFDSRGQVIVAKSFATTQLLSAKDGALLRLLWLGDYSDTIALPDGSLMFAKADRTLLRVFKAKDGKVTQLFSRALELQEQNLEGWYPLEFAFSPDGKLIFLSTDRERMILDAASGSVLWKASTNSYPGAAAFSPNGQLVAFVESNDVVVLRASDGKPVGRVPVGSAKKVALSPEGRRIAVVSWYGDMAVWQIEDKKKVFELAVNGSIQGVAWVSGSGTLVAAGRKGAEIWDVASSKRLNTLRMTSDVNIDFSESTNTLVGASYQMVEAWQMPSGSLIRKEGRDSLESTYLLEEAQIHYEPSIALFRDRRRAIVSFGDKRVWIWEIDGSQPSELLWEHTTEVLDVALSPDGKMAAWGTADGTAFVLNLNTRVLVRKISHNRYPVYTLAFSPDGRLLASGTADRLVRLWRISDGSLVASLSHPETAGDITFSPSGQVMAVAAKEHIYLWEPSSNRLLRKLEGHTYVVEQLAFSPDGRFLASGGADGTVRIWGLQ